MEREISLSNLFWKVALGWRRIIILGIVFAVLLSGLKFSKDLQNYEVRISGENASEMIEDSENYINAKNVQEKIDVLKKYMNESLYMNINPYNVTNISLQYMIDTNYLYDYQGGNEKDYSNNIIYAYAEFIESGQIAKELQTCFEEKTSTQYIQELITTELIVDNDTSLFVVKVILDDNYKIDDVKMVIKNSIEEESANINNVIGGHELNLLNEVVSVSIDKNLEITQTSIKDEVCELQNELVMLKATLTADELNRLEKNGETYEKQDNGILEKPTISFKYIIFGGFAGVLIALIWLVLEYLYATKLQEVEDVSSMYNIKIIDVIESANKEKINFIDAALLRLKDNGESVLSVEQQLELIATKIEVLCKNKGVEEILLCGEGVDEININMLKNLLSTVNIRVSNKSVWSDVDTFRDMNNIKNILYVEKLKKSSYKNICREIQIARENEIVILGCVIIK